jgi:hypothetical protein
VAAARVVQGYEELMMISAGGIVIRTPLETISERTGRATSGVILMNLREGDRMAAIAILEPSTNGNGDASPDAGDEDEPSAELEVEDTDAEALAALPTAEDVAASEEDDRADLEEDDDAIDEDEEST